MEETRDTAFARRIQTRIWQETPVPGNPWLAGGARCHGYDLGAMIAGLDYPSTIFLLLRGELPDAAQAALLRRFLVAFCNPGPRHAATRATMNAAASGTDPVHLGAIGLAILGGEHLGSAEVEAAARFLARHRGDDPAAIAAARIGSCEPAEGDLRMAPGFGTLHGAIDPHAGSLARALGAESGTWRTLDWGAAFARELGAAGAGWLLPGVAAAACLDLGFAPRTAAALFQIAALPGLLAHGLEMSRLGPEAMPFVPDEAYEMCDAATGAPA